MKRVAMTAAERQKRHREKLKHIKLMAGVEHSAVATVSAKAALPAEMLPWVVRRTTRSSTFPNGGGVDWNAVMIRDQLGEERDRLSNDLKERSDGNIPVDQITPQPVQSVESVFSTLPFVKDVAWTRHLFEWFMGGHQRTRRYAVYVFGAGGEGKTRIVRGLIHEKNVFECRLTERYALDGFDANTDILLVEGINWDSFDTATRSTLLNIMARQPAVIQRKHKTQISVVNDKVLTIFTSNFKLPDDVAFRRRCYAVWAQENACIDSIPDSEDDAGDDDSAYINPKLPYGVL